MKARVIDFAFRIRVTNQTSGVKYRTIWEEIKRRGRGIFVILLTPFSFLLLPGHDSPPEPSISLLSFFFLISSRSTTPVAKNTRKSTQFSPLLAVIPLNLPSPQPSKTLVPNLDKIQGEITTFVVSLGNELGAPNVYPGFGMQPCFKLLQLSVH